MERDDFWGGLLNLLEIVLEQEQLNEGKVGNLVVRDIAKMVEKIQERERVQK